METYTPRPTINIFRDISNSDIVESVLEQDLQLCVKQDDRGWHVLHYALQARVDPDIVLKLIKLHPDAAKVPMYKGFYAHHWAQKMQMSEAVVSTLMQAHICGAIESGVSPSVMVEILRQHPDGAQQLDARTGRLPLHWVVVQVSDPKQAKYDYSDLIRLLVRLHPAACNTPDMQNATPLYLTVSTPLGAVSLPERLLEVCKLLIEHTEEAHVCGASPHIAIRNWHKTLGALYGRYQLAEGPPIHKSATCKVHYAIDTTKKAGSFQSKVVLKMMRNRA